MNLCGNCAHFVGKECRRFPPVPCPVLIDNQTGAMDTAFVYPYLQADYPGCGEFKKARRAYGLLRATRPDMQPKPERQI